MQTYIAILRGINVSGKNTIKMEALKILCLNIGLQEVKMYIQSGNIVFKSKEKKIINLAELISQNISNTFNFNVPVIVIKKEELKAIIENNPYIKDIDKDPSFIHYTFLADIPKPENIQLLTTLPNTTDEFIIIEKAVYVYCPNGYGNTKLNNTFFEKKLQVAATTRNLKTTNQLLNMAML